MPVFRSMPPEMSATLWRNSRDSVASHQMDCGCHVFPDSGVGCDSRIVAILSQQRAVWNADTTLSILAIPGRLVLQRGLSPGASFVFLRSCPKSPGISPSFFLRTARFRPPTTENCGNEYGSTRFLCRERAIRQKRRGISEGLSLWNRNQHHVSGLRSEHEHVSEEDSHRHRRVCWYFCPDRLSSPSPKITRSRSSLSLTPAMGKQFLPPHQKKSDIHTNIRLLLEFA